MEPVKHNKLRFKFGLPLAVSKELSSIKDQATKVLREANQKDKKSPKKDFKGKSESKPSLVNLMKIKTSQKVIPKAIKQMIAYWHVLMQEYPLAFPVNSRPALKKGIVNDIASALQISKNAAKRFMSWYTSSKKYLASHQENCPRLDLHGLVVGCVSKEEADGKNHFLQRLWDAKKEITNNTTEAPVE
jgi:hypothetical protein